MSNDEHSRAIASLRADAGAENIEAALLRMLAEANAELEPPSLPPVAFLATRRHLSSVEVARLRRTWEDALARGARAPAVLGEPLRIWQIMDPASRWQAFKERHAMSWWLGWYVRRRPVRYEPTEAT